MKLRKIKLNGQEIDVNAAELTYDQIASMSYQPTITFSKGHVSKPQGIVAKGGSVKIVEGMVITCMRTGNA
jgi:hypothetical protein